MARSLLPIYLVIVCTQASRPHCDPVNSSVNDCGEPLFLTPFLEENRISEAREAARVRPMVPDIESYSGYLTVDRSRGSNLFFWFFPSESVKFSAPVVLWLAGGPGAATIPDIFVQNGPLTVREGRLVHSDDYYWTMLFNMIYIDNPIGAGFSFTRNALGYAGNQEQIARHLYSALIQILQLFPDFSKNELFIAGEGYVGKYVIALAQIIHKSNPLASKQINLKGIAIGDGWVDPVNQLGYSQPLFYMGLIDDFTRRAFSQVEDDIVTLIARGQYRDAAVVLNEYFPAVVSNGSSLVENVTGFKRGMKNVLMINPEVADQEFTDIGEFLNQPHVRETLHVGDQPFVPFSAEVLSYLTEDLVQSAAAALEELLDHYQVLLYSGQMDVTGAYSLTTNYVQQLVWGRMEEYKKASRHQWYVEGQLAGYFKSAGGLTEVLVRNAGLAIPKDQSLWALEMMKNFMQSHSQSWTE